MLDIAPSEFLLVAFVALVVIGPKDLPKAMRIVGYWVGKARGVARQFRQGFDNMVREAELEEMEKRWAAENARIMAEHPAAPAEPPATTEHDAGEAAHGEDHPPATVAQPVLIDAPKVEPAPADHPAPPREGANS
ncbi:twin-arginine translocase subunit TatB [Sphingomonas sp. MA1305]|uniref:Sec-independent protein translocase protein TatB n=1 Tax=Sphingomonas sp. MA1305 TaxID=2479204 RepID=UPI0018DF7D5C|nr:Sec-independent protein translocase protein TatB [Sphingomonas sp. MA1305]MBI0476572.1 twin-arginine translocase subunit TatB [Sphingomonas sp. MA1305]